MKKFIFPMTGLAIVAILYIASLENVIPFPLDASHITITDELQCFDCHGEGKEYSRKEDHPPKDRCFKCHKVITN